jgi:FdhE protein
MTQRILERGQIETLASRAIPRVRLPDRTCVFAQRAARLRVLASGNAVEGYLQFIAVLADTQQRVLAIYQPTTPSAEQIARAAEFGMPPFAANAASRGRHWTSLLRDLARVVGQASAMPDPVVAVCRQIAAADDEFLDMQANALLAAQDDLINPAMAPVIIAALQVHWVALTAAFDRADQVKTLDVPGVCPLCGTLPVASIVCAKSPYQGYRYLHCALCATEWHMVRVHCSSCGADGKHIAYHTLLPAEADADSAAKDVAVRAEACDTCHSYRKILYQEKDIAVDAVADDVATLALDVLLTEKGFHRASGNPMLWQPAQG